MERNGLQGYTGLHHFAIGLHIDWDKCHNPGESIVIPQVLMHANDIIADKGITAIHNLKIPPNIYREQSYQGPGWFHIPFIKSHSYMLAVFTDCSGDGKIRWTEELRIRFQKIKNKHFTVLELLQNYTMHFHSIQ